MHPRFSTIPSGPPDFDDHDTLEVESRHQPAPMSADKTYDDFSEDVIFTLDAEPST